MAKRFEVRAYGDEREVLVDGHPIEHLISSHTKSRRMWMRLRLSH